MLPYCHIIYQKSPRDWQEEYLLHKVGLDLSFFKKKRKRFFSKADFQTIFWFTFKMATVAGVELI